MADEIVLSVGGRRWSAWREASVTVRLGSAAGEFSFTLDDRWSAGAPLDAFTTGGMGTVAVAGETVLTGPIDVIEPAYKGDSYTVVMRGRDLTGQMIDCSAANKPGEWIGQTLSTIAFDLAEPFGVPVHIDADMGKPFEKFTISEGETAWAALRRACLHRGVLLMADGLGGLALTSAGAGGRASPIVAGQNVHAGKGVFDATARFSDYIVKGQDGGKGWGDVSAHASVEGRAKDPAVKRYRPHIEIAETSGNRDDLTRAAETMAAITAGRAVKTIHTFTDWRQELKGRVWRPNRVSAVRDEFLRVDRDMLIEQAAFTVNKEELRCEVTSVVPSAWKLAALPEKAEDAGW
ncbi:MAG TPA: hypothetical protein DEB21_20550 [Rhodospirillaceae bacterium]|nr:hypothetical protein [Rhodospirillaceae bacterium]